MLIRRLSYKITPSHSKGINMGYLVFKSSAGCHLTPSDDFTINSIKGQISVCHVNDKYDYPNVKDLRVFLCIEKAYAHFEDIRTKL